MKARLASIVLLPSALSSAAAAFAFDHSFGKSCEGMSRINVDKVDEPEPTFRVVLNRIGKTSFRPGGGNAAKTVQALANIGAGDTVLDLSTGLSKSGIELAGKYGAKVTMAHTDTCRLEKAQDIADKPGLSDLITDKVVDIFHIDDSLGPDAKFDVAQAEATMTNYPRSRKVQFFQGVAKHANKFILHEVCFKTDDEELQEMTKKDMSKVLKIGFFPETSDTWQTLLSDAGFTIETVITGNLEMLNPISMMRDEGVLGFVNIVCNVATQPYLRSRVLATKAAIARHSEELGYIAIVASKAKGSD